VIQIQGGQVLAFVAVALPLVLLPVAAYAVDSATVSGRAAGLQAAAAQAAETAAQQIDVTALRSSGELALDSAAAQAAALRELEADEPGAGLDDVSVGGVVVTIVASERVDLPFPLLARSITLTAHSTARLVPGYDRPSSLLPLPTSTF
jgi:Flp pilus assembly protein TadG